MACHNGLEFRVWGLGFGVLGIGFGVSAGVYDVTA